MRPAYDVATVRATEAELIATLPEHTLMQRAAYGLAVEVADILHAHSGGISGRLVVGFIGSGNNGSDALLAMTYLGRRGVKCCAVDVTGKRRADHTDHEFGAAGTWLTLEEVRQRAEDFDLVLDGIAGLGSGKPVASEVLEVAKLLHRSADVVAVDLPSGLDADGVAFRDVGVMPADFTVTFGCLKPCHVLDPFADQCGEVRLIDIGLELPLASLWQMDDDDAARLFTSPTTDDNKFSRGVVGVVAGSQQYPGAGLLSVRAARWGGAGMVQQIGGEFSVDTPSVVRVDSIANSRATALLVGPGLGDTAKSFVADALTFDGILVLDADALNAISGDAYLQSILRARKAITILTPHFGEARRLANAFGVTLIDVPGRDAQTLAAATNCVVYLKGSIGAIALPDLRLITTHRTCEHLATAGSGDVLAGLAASMLAHHQPDDEFAAAHVIGAAVITHSLAAEIIALDGEPVVAEELEQEIPAAIAQLTA